MCEYFGDFRTGKIVIIPWNTNAGDGASITRATNGTLKVYKNDSTTERSSAAGITETEDFDANTGVHLVKIDLSDNTDAGFYAAGNDYWVCYVGMTIDGKTVNHAIAHFSIENRSALMSTTADRKLTVGSSGHAAIDLDTTTGALAKGTEITGFNDLSTSQVNTEVDNALIDIRLDELLVADSDIDGAAPPTVGSVFFELMTVSTGAFTYDQTTDSMEATANVLTTRASAASTTAIQADVDDIQAKIGTPVNLVSGGATLAGNLQDIEAQTDDIGVAGAGLSAIPWSSSWDVEVQSECEDAIGSRLVLASGTADSGSTTTVVDAERTEADTDYWRFQRIRFKSGSVAGQTRLVTGFNATSDTLTFWPATTQAVSVGVTYDLLPASAVDVYAWLNNVVATPSVVGVPEVDVTHLVGGLVPLPTVVGVPFVDLQYMGGSPTPVSDLIVNIPNLNATITSRATPAQVGVEVDNALIDIRLDELLVADSDIDGAAPPVVGSVFHELMSASTGSFTFVQTTDSMEALADRLPDVLVGGRIKAHVGGMDDAVITDTKITDAFVAKVCGGVGPRRNVGFTFDILMVDSTDHVTPKTGLTVTGVRKQDAGTTFSAMTGTITEISNGYYKVVASAADMNADEITFKFSGTGADESGVTIKTTPA